MSRTISSCKDYAECEGKRPQFPNALITPSTVPFLRGYDEDVEPVSNSVVTGFTQDRAWIMIKEETRVVTVKPPVL